jgi:hypothetical protein
MWLCLVRQPDALRTGVKRQYNLGNCVAQKSYFAKINTATQVLQIIPSLQSFAKDRVLVRLNGAVKGDFEVPF